MKRNQTPNRKKQQNSEGKKALKEQAKRKRNKAKKKQQKNQLRIKSMFYALSLPPHITHSRCVVYVVH